MNETIDDKALKQTKGKAANTYLNAVGALESHAALDENAIGCAEAGPDHDRGGGGQAEGARAGNHQHRDAKEE